MGWWKKTLVALAVALGLATAAFAGEKEVKAKVEAFLGAPAVSSVRTVPYGGLYEVVLTTGEVVYTDEKVSYILTGSIIDTAKREDITAKRMDELARIDFSALPLDRAIKLVRGKGTRVLATFEDPNCVFCKKLAKELQTIDDVTIYVFLYPILGPDSVEKAKRIWCAPDRAQTWVAWMIEGKPVPETASCDTKAIEQNVALGEKLRISGTPTIFLASGDRLGGYLPAAKLEERLKRVR